MMFVRRNEWRTGEVVGGYMQASYGISAAGRV